MDVAFIYIRRFCRFLKYLLDINPAASEYGMEFILFVKLLVSVILVLTLSAVAEHISPRAAGLLAGYPAGAAITLFFIGLDVSPD